MIDTQTHQEELAAILASEFNSLTEFSRMSSANNLEISKMLCNNANDMINWLTAIKLVNEGMIGIELPIKSSNSKIDYATNYAIIELLQLKRKNPNISKLKTISTYQNFASLLAEFEEHINVETLQDTITLESQQMMLDLYDSDKSKFINSAEVM